MALADDIALANALADAAGAAIRPFFRARYDIENKADTSPVTEADRAAELAIRKLIEAERPRDGIIGEAFGTTRWVGAMGTPTLFNGKPVRTRACRDLDQAILATTGPQYFPGHLAEHFSILGGQCRDTIWGGDCYNYALVASGHVDIVVEAGLKLYDIAALVPVVEGAGGRMCDWSGEPLTDASEGNVIAIGDPARLDDVIEALSHCPTC